MSAWDVIGAFVWTLGAVVGATLLADPENTGALALVWVILETCFILASAYCIHRVLA